MKKSALLIAALGALTMTGCGWFTCGTETKTDKKTSVESKSSADKKADAADKMAKPETKAL